MSRAQVWSSNPRSVKSSTVLH